MKTLYFECLSGISGDMTVASLLDLGVDPDYVMEQLRTMHMGGYKINIYPGMKNGIEGVRFEVTLLEHDHGHGCDCGCGEHHHTHTCMGDIEQLIDHSGLNENVRGISLDIFRRIAEAEARIHGIEPEQVHFHEVGAVDSIIDIVATAVCIDVLKPDRIAFSPIREGRGFTECAHGRIPVPAPATLELLRSCGAAVEFADVHGEMVTPTGAGIAAALGDVYGAPCPAGELLEIGYGCGKKDFAHPNILRTYMVESREALPRNSVCVLECTVDDMTGEQLGYAMAKLFDAGCVDAYFTPVYMKKNRPGHMITAVCPPSAEKDVTHAIFKHTSTMGVRAGISPRHVMARQVVRAQTRYGQIDVKRAVWGDIVKLHPESDQVCAAAEEHGVSVQDVENAARNAALDAGK